jgi:hypothetical protein
MFNLARNERGFPARARLGKKSFPLDEAGYVVGGVEELDPSAQAKLADVRISACDHP